MALSERHYTRSEQRLDRLLHHTGLIAAIAGVGVLIGLTVRHQDALTLFAVSLYSLGLITMLAASTLANHDMHAPPEISRPRERFDHAAIFLMIAGTYTPFTILVLPPVWGWGLFGFVWSLALLGAGFQLTDRLAYAPAIALYLSLGWSILPAIGPLIAGMPPVSLGLLIGGGVVYSLGILAFAAYRLPFHTVIWHAAVLSAAACHYSAVLTGVVLPRGG